MTITGAEERLMQRLLAAESTEPEPFDLVVPDPEVTDPYVFSSKDVGWRELWQQSRYLWALKARPNQITPSDELDWLVWLFLAGRGTGKALALDTPIPLSDGWTTMEKVKIGDRLLSMDGTITQVTYVSPVQLGNLCFRVTFNDGSSVIADADHQWVTQNYLERRRLKRERVAGAPGHRYWSSNRIDIFEGIRTTKELEASNHSMPVAKPLQLRERQLPVDPYVFGAWLGDGDSKYCTICGVDDQIFDEIAKIYPIVECKRDPRQPNLRAAKIGWEPHKATRDGWIAQGPFYRPLRDMGVVGAGKKRIPQQFLRGSVAQRLALLQGLMDTDGTSGTRGNDCGIGFVNKQLADDTYELIVSLGHRAYRNEKQVTARGGGTRTFYGIGFIADPDLPPFRLKRKLERIPPRTGKGHSLGAERRARLRYVKSVEEIPSVPVRCISVDHPSETYLCGTSMLVTHNTRAGAEDISEFTFQNPDSRIGLVSSTGDDVRDTMVEGESGILSVIPAEALRGGSVSTGWNRSLMELYFANGSRCKGFSAESPERLRGPQHHRAWMDEPASWRHGIETWDMAMFGLRLGANPKAIVTGTPKPTKLIKQLVKAKTTHLTHGTTYENLDNLAPTFRQAILEKYEGTRLGRQELLAEILEEAEGSLWKSFMFEEEGFYCTPPNLERVVVGVDPSGTAGGDACGIIVAGMANHQGYVLEDLTIQASPDAWARVVVKAYHDYEADRVVVEGNFGGEMAEVLLREVDRNVPVKTVHASRGKKVRAEPIAALYEQRRVHHSYPFGALESEMTSWDPGERGAPSPNRIDAVVWALTDLISGYAGPVTIANIDRLMNSRY